MKWTACVVGVVGVAGLAIAVGVGWQSTSSGLDNLKSSHYSNQVLVFELIRTAAGAALLGAFVWGTLNLARAALDQSTRYEKRFIAGHFLVYVLRKFEAEIKDGSIKLPDVMSVFKAWSDSVDSAFTHVKFGYGRTKPCLSPQRRMASPSQQAEPTCQTSAGARPRSRRSLRWVERHNPNQHQGARWRRTSPSATLSSTNVSC
jgi:hypothetical protein